MKRFNLTLQQIMVIKSAVKDAPFAYKDVDYALGRAKREDGSWCFWLKDGRRIDIIINDIQLILRKSDYPDADRPRVVILKEGRDSNGLRTGVFHYPETGGGEKAEEGGIGRT